MCVCTCEVGEEVGVTNLYFLVCDFNDWAEGGVANIVGIVSLIEL